MGAAYQLPAAVLGRFYKPGTALNRVLAEAPYLPRCSDDKTATRVRPREYAIRYPYMQLNRTGFVSWLIFDLDHNDSWRWERVGLPPPNMIVRNRKSGHSHLYYAINPVCTTEHARSAPITYMKAVYAAFSAKLAADPDFHSGPVAKTPGHPWWLTEELHGQVYDLGELAEYVELPRRCPWAKAPDIEHISHSRHCTLFELLRRYAYSIVGSMRETGTFDIFMRVLETFAHDKNRFSERGFSSDLPFSSIKATVRSVARWTWDRYSGSGNGCMRGIMRLDESLPLAHRQKVSAERTHELRHKATEAKIISAIRLLKARGEKPTMVAIAKMAWITRQTVAKYKHLLTAQEQQPTAAQEQQPMAAQEQQPTAAQEQQPTAAQEQQPTAAQEQQPTAAQNVKFAVYQIPAGFAPLAVVKKNQQSGGEAAAEPHAPSGQQDAQGGKPTSRAAQPSTWIPIVIRSSRNE